MMLWGSFDLAFAPVVNEVGRLTENGVRVRSVTRDTAVARENRTGVLSGRCVLVQLAVAEQVSTDKQTSAQESYGGVQVEGGPCRNPGREGAFGAGGTV